MSPDKLVRMVNQIATFFRSQDEASAPAMVADHLEKFWEPRMRKAIVAHGRAGGSGLDPIAARAVMLLAEGAGGS
ncbi:MAG: formate dehydrogenase subunit delta [Rhodospirillales bacterium]|nr:formate dehydrogenase subunit delta [Rhodospirillales bacterium]